jgi:hypothetical protein
MAMLGMLRARRVIVVLFVFTRFYRNDARVAFGLRALGIFHEPASEQLREIAQRFLAVLHGQSFRYASSARRSRSENNLTPRALRTAGPITPLRSSLRTVSALQAAASAKSPTR